MPRKKRSTFGSVARLAPDRWRLRWWADGPDGRKRRTEVVHGTRRQAEDRLAEIRLSVGSTPGGCPTVKEVHDKWWWPDAQRRLRSNTLGNYGTVWRLYIDPAIGHVPCDQVMKHNIQAILDAAPASQAKVIRNVLGSLFSLAEDMGHVAKNVAHGRMIEKDAVPKDRRVWTLAQLSQAWDAVRGNVCEVPFIMEAHAGCRVGESIGIMLDEIRFDEVDGEVVAVAPIVRQVDDLGAVLEDPKNKQSLRHTAVGEPWSIRLRELAEEARERGEVWLVDNGDGTPVPQHRVRYQWKACCRKTGIDPIPLRNLRASFETTAHWELGEDQARVGKMMGHASGSSVTYRAYDRPSDDHVAQRAASMGKRAKEVLGSV